MRWVLGTVVVVLAGALASPAAATPSRLVAAVGDQKPVVRGFLDAPSSFVRRLTVTAVGGPVQWQVQTRDLHSRDADATIGRDSVTVDGPATIARGDRATLTLEVVSVPAAGMYAGELLLLTKSVPRRVLLAIPLRVQAVARPTLTLDPNAASITFGATRCSGSCWFADAIVGHASTHPTSHVMLTASPRTPVTIVRAWASVSGRDGHGTVPLRDLGIVVVATASAARAPTAAAPAPAESPPLGDPAWKPVTVPRGAPIDLVLTPRLGAIDPDHYSGNVYLRVAHQDTPVAIPVSFDVRRGPALPAFVLALGLLAGWMQRRMSRGTAQLAAIRQATQADDEAGTLWPADCEAVSPLVADALRRANAGDDATASPLAARALLAIRHLKNAEQIVGSAYPGGIPFPATVNRALQELRGRVRDGDLAAALEAVRAAVTAAGDAPADEIAAVPAAAVVAAPATVVSPEGRGRRDLLRYRLPLSLRAAQGFLAVLTALGLAAVGLHELYVAKGASFGSTGFWDYAALFFWGFLATKAGQTLAAVAVPEKPAPAPVAAA